MKGSRISLFVTAISLTFLLIACSGKPTEMIQKTEQAKKEAETEHADFFAPDFWRLGEKAMADANVQLGANNYGEASNLLLKARTNYVKARDSAKDKRAQTIFSIKNMQVTVNKRLKSDLVDNPAAANLSPARRKELEVQIKEIEANSTKVTSLLDNGQYADADELVNKTIRKIFETQQEFLKK